MKTSTSRKSTTTAKSKKATSAGKAKAPVARTANLDRAIKDYARRERRFGGLATGPSDSEFRVPE